LGTAPGTHLVHRLPPRGWIGIIMKLLAHARYSLTILLGDPVYALIALDHCLWLNTT
jgi:hypothetical protein